MHTYATMKLWSRRWRKLGFLLIRYFGWLLKVVTWVPRMFLHHPFEMILISIFVSVVGCTIYFEHIRSSPATPQMIADAIKIDSCVSHTLKVRADQLPKAMTIAQVNQTISDCEDYWRQKNLKQAQQDAFK